MLINLYYKMHTLILIGIVVIKYGVRSFVWARVKTVFRADLETQRSDVDQEVQQAILHALKGIRFGSVEIIVHDSKVVQIERKEKLRMDRP